MNTKRIFVGYQLSKKLQKQIGKWQQKHNFLPVRWTPLENLHVTLVPPWYEEKVDDVIRLLQSIEFSVTHIPILFEMITLGPENKRPWLMWARGKMPAELFALELFLIDILQRKTTRKGPILHTTLARFSLEQFEQFPQKQFLEKITWREMIGSFSLMESHLHRTGVVYKTLTEIRL